jgi:hypothetical protein
LVSAIGLWGGEGGDWKWSGTPTSPGLTNIKICLYFTQSDLFTQSHVIYAAKKKWHSLGDNVAHLDFLSGKI